VEWRWSSAWAAVPAGYARKDLVIPGPVAGVSGPDDVKTVTLTAAFADNPGAAVSYAITLVPLLSPVKAVLRGPSGDVRADKLIVLNASSSLDPDDPANATPFAITWGCTRADYPTPCFAGTAYGMQAGLSWSLSASLLTPGVQHTFTATVSKAGRSASASVSLTPVDVRVPTGRVLRVCASAAGCPARHSASAPLALSLVSDSPAATVAWSSDQGIPALAAAGNSRDIVLPAASLPASGAVAVTATLTSAGGSSSKTSILVPINARPQCSGPSGSCLVITSASSVFPGASFAAQAVGITDDSTSLK
jgi:hypothetical protein